MATAAAVKAISATCSIDPRLWHHIYDEFIVRFYVPRHELQEAISCGPDEAGATLS
ncbi:hypothetical protein LPN01_07540 [Sphingomonas sp. A2-49]|uniref:hypothetical protein n=1 Tax=Sphingomonas sp. A2-49 TaxID=1391375 RepID=UPI0021D134E7|nr:hypothetical protein [Sphingomonas sp. A2-49]MCU6453927.1 hypothetical protein [Sphingomonas sp. A2-49]